MSSVDEPRSQYYLLLQHPSESQYYNPSQIKCQNPTNYQLQVCPYQEQNYMAQIISPYIAYQEQPVAYGLAYQRPSYINENERHVLPTYSITVPPFISERNDRPIASLGVKCGCPTSETGWGLCIYHSEYINQKESFMESNCEMFKDTLDVIQQLRSVIARYVEIREMRGGLIQKIKEYNDMLGLLYQNLYSMTCALQRIYSIRFDDEKYNENSVVTFCFEYRGLFITIRYVMEKQLRKIRTLWKVTEYLKGYEKLEKSFQKAKVLLNLTQMGLIMIEKRELAIRRCIQEDFFGDVGDQYAPKLRKFLRLMVAITASYSKSLKYEPKFRSGIFFSSSLYYMLNAKHAAKKLTTLLARDVSVETWRSLWAMQDENKFVKLLTFLSLPDVEVSATFSIPFIKYTLNTPNIYQQLSNDEYLAAKEYERIEECLGGVGVQEIIGSSTMKELEFYLNQIPKILSIIPDLSNTISLRIISKKRLNINATSNMAVLSDIRSSRASFQNDQGTNFSLHRDFPHLSQALHCLHKIRKPFFMSHSNITKESDGLIFHLHGGGFLAMSSFSHETYLRSWAIETGLSIISVDYTNTPKQHYPVQVEECYQAYKWVLQNAEQHLGISLKKIVFAGDSAGGNLVLAVLIRAIYDGLRIPDALVLSYPATYLDLSPSASRIISFLDPLLNYKILELCGMEYYLNPNRLHVKNNAKRNPLISPCMAPIEILQKFPRTYINVGALDPLLDDSIYLAKRLEEAIGKKRIRVEIYDSLGHGYLNLLHFVYESKIANRRLCEWINQVINQ
jgi:acetyl esterase/lipase